MAFPNVIPVQKTEEQKLADSEALLLHQLESVMRSTYVREMPPSSRKRVIELLCYRYTEA